MRVRSTSRCSQGRRGGGSGASFGGRTRIAEEETDVGLVRGGAGASRRHCFVRAWPSGARPVRSVLLVSEVRRGAHGRHPRRVIAHQLVLARLLLRARRMARSRGAGAAAAQALPSEGESAGAHHRDVALDIEHRFPHVVDLGSAWLEWTGCPSSSRLGGRRGRCLRREQVSWRQAEACSSATHRDLHAERAGLTDATCAATCATTSATTSAKEGRRGLERSSMKGTPGLLRSSGALLRGWSAREAHVHSFARYILARAAEGDRLTGAEGERLLASAIFDWPGGRCVRRRKHRTGGTYIVDRNVTNQRVHTTAASAPSTGRWGTPRVTCSRASVP